jgi:hypothetical protein
MLVALGQPMALLMMQAVVVEAQALLDQTDPHLTVEPQELVELEKQIQ